MSEDKKTAGRKRAGRKPKETAPTAQQAAPLPPAGGSWVVARVLKVTKPLLRGDDVKALQTALTVRGYSCGVGGTSGVYERNTAYAVRRFQSANRLIVDGKAGHFTVAALGGIWEG